MDYAVIMAGGIGTRFWPHSRKGRPKQFLPIAGDRPMIAETTSRVAGVVPAERILVVTRASQVDMVREACPEVPDANILAEPVGRNTAPCIALAALKVVADDPEAVLLCLPADHVIRPAEVFHRTTRVVLDRAREGRTLLTFGIPPTHAATGFGYIERGDAVTDAVHRVVRFVEKPDAETARGYLETGRFLWNSGMFAWRADVYLEEMDRHLPEVTRALAPVANRAGPTVDPALDEAYRGLTGISVDYGIMERAGRAEVVPADFEWDDVGSWRALERLLDADGHGNVARGEYLGLDSRGVVAVAGEDHTIATIGVRDLVIVRTDDVTLVCPKDRAEDVKKLVERLEETGRDDLG
jgi:mannose-1-phosphate guanylyltransferase